MDNTDTKYCAKCNGKLIETSRTVKQMGNYQSPVMTVSYRCADDNCQAAMDKRQLDLIKQREEREAQKRESQKKQVR